MLTPKRHWRIKSLVHDANRLWLLEKYPFVDQNDHFFTIQFVLKSQGKYLRPIVDFSCKLLVVQCSSRKSQFCNKMENQYLNRMLRAAISEALWFCYEMQKKKKNRSCRGNNLWLLEGILKCFARDIYIEVIGCICKEFNVASTPFEVMKIFKSILNAIRHYTTRTAYYQTVMEAWQELYLRILLGLRFDISAITFNAAISWTR
jgi:hypothetical protein